MSSIPHDLNSRFNFSDDEPEQFDEDTEGERRMALATATRIGILLGRVTLGQMMGVEKALARLAGGEVGR